MRTLGGRYRLERPLGSGASATVWLAFDAELERRVAVKVLAEGRGGDADRLERFRREARSLARLRHPHVVTVIDSGEQDGTPYIVLEYVGGETLKERIKRDGPLAIDEAIAYAIEVARALEAAHAQGIVHRDIKSQNILLDPDGGVKLTDFGIARSGAEAALTQGGRVLGTTDYVSPEQALGRAVAGQSDVYSLGIVLFEMLTGAVPFSAPSQVAVATMHVRHQIPDVQRLRPEVSAALAAVVDRATAKHLDRRYPDARSMIVDLEQALAIETARRGEPSGAASAVLRTLPATRRRLPLSVRHPSSRAITAAALVLVLAAVAVFALLRVHRNEPARRARTPGLETPVSLAGARATSYNPFGTGVADNASQAALVLDARPGTAWSTNRYARGELNKPGVGVYMTLSAAAAANRLELVTPTPGFDVEVWASERVPGATGAARGLAALGWTQLGRLARVSRTAEIALHGGAVRYPIYLVWITKLEPGAPGAWIAARIGRVELWRATGR
ncbi:MAG TPA: protein kinase [Solirubrobacteraceae bacterium]|nr:protein kinase [Solirubrobacteraceae bacterium]